MITGSSLPGVCLKSLGLAREVETLMFSPVPPIQPLAPHSTPGNQSVMFEAFGKEEEQSLLGTCGRSFLFLCSVCS